MILNVYCYLKAAFTVSIRIITFSTVVYFHSFFLLLVHTFPRACRIVKNVLLIEISTQKKSLKSFQHENAIFALNDIGYLHSIDAVRGYTFIFYTYFGMMHTKHLTGKKCYFQFCCCCLIRAFHSRFYFFFYFVGPKKYLAQ